MTGATRGLAAIRRRVTPAVKLLAVSSAPGLAAIDGFSVARQRLSPVHLLGAAAELALIAGRAVELLDTLNRLTYSVYAHV